MCTSSVSVYSGTSHINESQRASRSGSKLRKLAPSPLGSARWTQSPPLARVVPCAGPLPSRACQAQRPLRQAGASAIGLDQTPSVLLHASTARPGPSSPRREASVAVRAL